MTLGRETSLALFRAAQECLTNTARHAGAASVEIRLRQNEEVLLEVRDDGRGIDAARIYSAESIGLIGMRERTRRLGGTLAIEGVAGKGTIVTIRLPGGGT